MVVNIDEINYIDLTRTVMQEIQLDNGYGHFEGISYPKEWVDKIAIKLQEFFKANPNDFNDETFEMICSPCEGDDDFIEYMKKPVYAELNELLNEYANDGMGTGKVEENPRLMHTLRKDE